MESKNKPKFLIISQNSSRGKSDERASRQTRAAERERRAPTHKTNSRRCPSSQHFMNIFTRNAKLYRNSLIDDDTHSIERGDSNFLDVREQTTNFVDVFSPHVHAVVLIIVATYVTVVAELYGTFGPRAYHRATLSLKWQPMRIFRGRNLLLPELENALLKTLPSMLLPDIRIDDRDTNYLVERPAYLLTHLGSLTSQLSVYGERHSNDRHNRRLVQKSHVHSHRKHSVLAL